MEMQVSYAIKHCYDTFRLSDSSGGIVNSKLSIIQYSMAPVSGFLLALTSHQPFLYLSLYWISRFLFNTLKILTT